jgi:hypothetical protein
MAATNFNNAGADDIAVVNNEGFFDINGRTFVGLGNRRFDLNGFSAPADSNVIVAANFDSDGIPDLVFSDNVGLSFLVGESTGDFSSSLGAQPASQLGPIPGRRMAGAEVLKAADLDGDGLIDLVGLVSDGTEIEVARNVRDQPTPTPAANTSTPTNTAPGPTATFTPPPPTVTPTPIPTAGLGRCDYEASNRIGKDLARAVAAGDLDGIGGPDVAVSDGTRVSIVFFDEGFPNRTLMECARAFYQTGSAVEPDDRQRVSVSGAGDLALIDLGEDASGDLEIAVASAAGVDFLVRGSDGLFARDDSIAVPIAQGRVTQLVSDYASDPRDQRRRAALDLNRDGVPDLLAANEGSLMVSILYGRGGGEGFDPVPVSVEAPSSAVSAGDFNADRCVDFVVATSSGVRYLIQEPCDPDQVVPRPEFKIRGTVSAEVEDLQTGFFNNDARADVFIGDITPAVRMFITAAGDNFSNPTRLLGVPLEGTPSSVKTLIFGNLDARLDGVAAVRSESYLVFGLGSGEGAFERVLTPLATGPGPLDIAIADFDSDLQLDLVTANEDGTISILITSEPPPTPTPTETPTVTVSETPTVTETATVTATSTASETPSGTPAEATSTPTNTKEGIFELSGSGCEIDPGRSANLPVGLLLALLVILTGRAGARSTNADR